MYSKLNYGKLVFSCFSINKVKMYFLVVQQYLLHCSIITRWPPLCIVSNVQSVVYGAAIVEIGAKHTAISAKHTAISYSLSSSNSRFLKNPVSWLAWEIVNALLMAELLVDFFSWKQNIIIIFICVVHHETMRF